MLLTIDNTALFEICPSFRVWLRMALINSEIRREDFAKMVNCNISTVNFWIRGAFQPRVDTVRQIADILDVKHEDILIKYY